MTFLWRIPVALLILALAWLCQWPLLWLDRKAENDPPSENP